MKIKIRFTQILLSAILGGIFYLAFGWFVFDYSLGNYMEQNTTSIQGFKKSESESSLLMLIISCFAYSTLLSVIFGFWTSISTFKLGTIAGSVIGVLIAIMADCYWYSTSHFFNSIYPLLFDVAGAGLTVGLMGGVIGWVLGLNLHYSKK